MAGAGMSTAEELVWTRKSGRDGDGDKFDHHVLSHSTTGRILAKVYAPCTGDDYHFEISFFYGSGYKGRKLDTVPGQFRFIELKGAMEFVEKTVGDVGLGTD